MSSLNATVDQSAPSLDQVRAKIEARYARALGTSELSGQTVEARMLEVQQATIGSEARSRLDVMRVELGMPSGGEATLGAGSAGALGAGQPAQPGQPGQLTGGATPDPAAAGTTSTEPGDAPG
jgi:hypothetical protein